MANPFKPDAWGGFSIRIYPMGEGSAFVRSDGNLWSPVSTDSLIQTAKNLFGADYGVVLEGLDKDAFLALCFDLWEEAHGEFR